MKPFFNLLILVMAFYRLAAAEDAAPKPSPVTEVVIVGTLHQGHYQNPHYSPDVLKDILVRLKPSAILNELPLSQIETDGRPKKREKDKYPENWAADTAAGELKIHQIAFDRPDGQNISEDPLF